MLSLVHVLLQFGFSLFAFFEGLFKFGHDFFFFLQILLKFFNFLFQLCFCARIDFRWTLFLAKQVVVLLG